jgi:hypothetical protein
VEEVRYLTVYIAMKGQPILPETAEKIKAAVLKMTGVSYIGPFVLIELAEPTPVALKRR